MNTQKPDAVELLPCPFCGGNAELRNDDDEFWYISCNECINQTTHFFNGKDVVIARWNRRDHEARLVEALEQEVYRLNNHDMHLDIGGMAEDAAVPCPVCEACERIWAIIHPEDALAGHRGERSLDDQIASGTKSWDGVDTDKFTDEMRGR